MIPAVGVVDLCVQARGGAAPQTPGKSDDPGARPLSEDDAEAHVHGICFKTGPPGQVGVELEWLVSDQRDPGARVEADRVMQAVADLTSGKSRATGNSWAQENPRATGHSRAQGKSRPPETSQAAAGPRTTGNSQTVADSRPALPGGGMLSTEPGGQLELSSAPAPSLDGCIAAAGADLATLRDATQAAGLQLSGHGLDPIRPPQRVLDLPRYAAMEEFFDRRGPWGRVMMCNTASVQVCLDAGREGTGESSYRSRWRLVHSIGPVLVAAFANSPVQSGRASGWRCTRQAVWSRLDPYRTRAPAGAEPAPGTAAADDVDPRDAWTSYALDAEVMCIRRDGDAGWAAPPGVTFRDWLHGAGERPPTEDDLRYHLTTLFPPVRPHGHMELRMIDAQPGDGWIVPTAVVTALLDDPKAADAAMAATEPLWAGSGRATVRHEKRPEDPWLLAAWHGPSDSRIARASRACFEAADAALGRSGASAKIRRAVAAFTEKYVLRGRCPADDRLKENSR